MSARFADRAAAGRELAAALASRYRDGHIVVLGLPRGGVPVAAEVARALGADLDVFLVRKLGVPGRPELAFGAVASGGARVINTEVVRGTRIGEEAMERISRRERAELARRESAYRGDRPPPQLAGRTVVIVDDGIATGASARAALDGVRAHRPRQIAVAAPVAPAEAVAVLERIADEVVVLHVPHPFGAVGLYYDEFGQLSDDDVALALR